MLQDKEEQQSFCLVRDHDMLYASLQCTFQNCDQQSRLVCPQCLYQKLHDHGQSDTTTHIINTDQVNQEQRKSKEQASIEIMKILEVFKIKINQRLQEFQDIIQNSYFFRNINNLNISFIPNDCFQKIDMLQNITNRFQADFEICTQKYLDEIDFDSLDLNNQLSKFQDSQILIKQACCFELLNYSNEFKGFPGFEAYQIQKPRNNMNFQNFSRQYAEKTQILFNQDNLIRIQQNDLEVYNIHNKQLIQRKRIKEEAFNGIYCASYNLDNSILYFGDQDGYVYGCKVNKNYDIVFKRKLYSGWVCRLYIINDEIISIGASSVLKITNIRTGKQIFQRKLIHNYNISLINYDFIRGNIIVQCLSEVTILNRFNHKTIFYQNLGFGNTLQFIHPNYLILLSREILKKFEINYQQNQVDEIKQFQGYNFETFSYLEVENKVILISFKEIFILDQEFDLIQKISLPYFKDDLAYICKIQYFYSLEQIVIVKNGIYNNYISKAKYQFLRIYQVSTKKCSSQKENQYIQENINQQPINDIQICGLSIIIIILLFNITKIQSTLLESKAESNEKNSKKQKQPSFD